MAAGKNSSEKKLYYHAIRGKFVRKSDPSDPEAIKRFSKNLNKDVFEVEDDWISGRITSIRFETHEAYGKHLILEVDDIGEKCSINIRYESSYFNSFAEKCPNLIPGKDVKLSPYDFKPQGKDRRYIGINILQDGNKLERAISNDDLEANGIKFPSKGPDDKYDEEEIKLYQIRSRKFLFKVVEDKIKEFEIFYKKGSNDEVSQPADDFSTSSDGFDDVDDLPF